MATLIRKCANPRCSDIIGSRERPNKKFCSIDCKNKAHNDKNSKEYRAWSRLFESYDTRKEDLFLSFKEWLEKNYYVPREIKHKKQ
jgi:hypothetical protein